jgi:hypothetical protein
MTNRGVIRRITGGNDFAKGGINFKSEFGRGPNPKRK